MSGNSPDAMMDMIDDLSHRCQMTLEYDNSPEAKMQRESNAFPELEDALNGLEAESAMEL